MSISNSPGFLPTRQGILSLTIKDVNTLYHAYISFTKSGGLFIPTGRNYFIGDEVLMLLTLMEEMEKIPVAGKVVWITPRGAQSNRVAGIGVQFNEINGGAVRAKIETYLAGMLRSEKPTYTM
jgi:type IV pilus assembly protein PilZ